MRDHDDGAVAGQLDQRVGDDVLGEYVQVGGRLVQQHVRAVGEDDPRQRQAGPFTGGESGTVLADLGVEALRKRAHALLEGHAPQDLPHGVVAGPRRAQPHVVAHGAGDEDRPLRKQRHAWAPCLAPDQVPAGEHLSAVGLAEPGEHVQQRGLPAAGRTGDRGETGGRHAQRDRVQSRDPAAGVGHGDPVDDQFALRGHEWSRRLAVADEQGVHLLERRGALRSGVELRAHTSQRPVGLGCQQQHDQRGPQVEAATGEPDADRHRDQCHGQGRDQLQHRRRGERDA